MITRLGGQSIRVNCSSCGLLTETLWVVAGCIKGHVGDQFICDSCVGESRLMCMICKDAIWDFSVYIATDDEPTPEWYTSWEGYYTSPK